MARLDYYDIRPAGLDAYLSHYGYHFSPAMARWAVSMMEFRKRTDKLGKEDAEKLLADREIDFSKAKAHDLLLVNSDCFGVPGWARVGYCVSADTIRNSRKAWEALKADYE